jgi:hypothetical protein
MTPEYNTSYNSLKNGWKAYGPPNWTILYYAMILKGEVKIFNVSSCFAKTIFIIQILGKGKK